MNRLKLGAVAGAILMAGSAVQAAGPKNVILMVGDGMGFHQIEAASLYA